ncbi:CC/Se motif family (seleno)protein [Desulfurella sp.]|uniref:CC/Se motif family (seleno)protein n=1 Tax=Desulfurella sp. TaxID=1962857 RepID=UPI003D0B56D0
MKIDASARDYILKKGGKVSITYHDVANTCIDVKTIPEVSIGLPPSTDKYILLNIDGIDVYVDKFVGDSDNLKIKLNKVFGFKYLVLDGWKTI